MEGYSFDHHHISNISGAFYEVIFSKSLIFKTHIFQNMNIFVVGLTLIRAGMLIEILVIPLLPSDVSSL